MNSKKTLLIIVVALAALLGGAGVLYNVLGSQTEPQQLALQNQPQEDMAPEEQTVNNDQGQVQEEQGETNSEAQQPPLAPDFTVYDGEGEAVKLSDFAGKPVVLNFWASWCGPCKSEMPHFETAYAQYGEEIAFLMVNCTGGRETLDSAKEFMEESGYTFPVYYDTEMKASFTYGASSIPLTYFIDADGYAIARGMGALSLEVLETGIGMILPQ